MTNQKEGAQAPNKETVVGVNEYFRQFYPEDWADPAKYEFESWLGGMLRYQGAKSNIFPAIVCRDGFIVSVQGHAGAYSTPRDDFADHYAAVECGFPSEREELLMPFIDGDAETTDPTTTVYGYVPLETVEAVLAKHGGISRPATKEDYERLESLRAALAKARGES